MGRPAARQPSSSRRTWGTIACQRPHVVAERLAEAAGLDEVALHVDDDQGGTAARKSERVGLRVGMVVSVSSMGPRR